MKILMDTNVLIDNLLKRDPFYKQSDEIIEMCINGDVRGFLAAHSITNAFYVMRKDYSEDKRREMLLEMCRIFEVVGIDGDKLRVCLGKNSFKDFEDCLQSECAVNCGADYIITRNIKDFSESSVKAVSPEEFLKMLRQ
ncbi:MAG: PIN domain-containing protein [Ruminococcus sp.]|nr:PIN domain-containing protein [Ruminococcus sp.]